MNELVSTRLRRGIAIALKQFPILKICGEESGIYLWERTDEDGKYCWYVGKARRLLNRTAQHIVDGKSHLDLSIKAHGFYDEDKKPNGWRFRILKRCIELHLDAYEQDFIREYMERYPDGRMYNVESGGTTGKTIIGEKKQRRDVKWKTEARAKVLAEFREYFDIVPKDNAIKGKDELKVKAEALQQEYYNGQVSYDNDYWKIKTFLKEHGFNDLDEVIARWENEF